MPPSQNGPSDKTVDDDCWMLPGGIPERKGFLHPGSFPKITIKEMEFHRVNVKYEIIRDIKCEKSRIGKVGIARDAEKAKGRTPFRDAEPTDTVLPVRTAFAHAASCYNPKEPEASNAPVTISCYGCGKTGFYRSNCPNCSQAKTEIPTQSIQFYSFNTITHFSTQVPTIPIIVCGIKGYAHIDTAARTSVAGATLYECLKKYSNFQFRTVKADVTLADGHCHEQEVQTVTTSIEIGDKTLSISFVVLPKAEDNRTLLGIDFLEQAAIVLNIPQRYWNFADRPGKRFNFLNLEKGKTPELLFKPRKPTPLRETTNTVISAASIDEQSSPFLEFFSSPLPSAITPKEECYRLHPISTPDRSDNRDNNDNDYSPGMIYDIFKDTLPDTYSPPQSRRDPSPSNNLNTTLSSCSFKKVLYRILLVLLDLLRFYLKPIVFTE
ncbi:hypothetical protein NQ315_011306 [Exocentrus adspersus]|uniref:CCHC-type domain-containing protein n=1 Tax=Exocentrus adspersus TaxID=1586481 RepID=A0AAV8VJF4_9CUCU|nr:hypothetical protein NQ315_011306 [Exocentrus adspersus]